ncbi:hypothetical protein MNB_ARC-1_1243 [hydrothermal vent metagenome]|uniref:DUF2304 domain-containing protein n=1 Tax=hydrothermal vent metagenome TaxID=652676 RepID=A0A3B1E7I2_9ZZZZ
MVKNRKIKEEYSILWFFMGFGFLALSMFPNTIDILGNIFSISYAPTLILLFLFAFVLLVLIHFSIVLSKLSEQNKDLIQEVGLLKHELDNFKNK